MQIFTLILCILAIVVISSFISRFVPKVSTPLIQILLGALASQLPFFPSASLDPELFMVLFIAPLLYYEAHEIDTSTLLKNLNLSLSLAIGLVLATMVAIGFAVHAVWPAASLAAAFALGAALGPTDAVAVESIASEASLSQRQRGILQGESLFNDASGVIGFQFSILAATTGAFSAVDATREFVVSFVGGTFFGLVAGLIVNWLFETIRQLGWQTVTTRVLMELFLPFLLYLGAMDFAHVSGILAVVAAGFTIHFDRSGLGPNAARTNIVSNSVWSVLSFCLNGSVFILLGTQLPGAMRASWENAGVSNNILLGIIALASLVVIALRFLWVAFMIRVGRDPQTHRRERMTPERWISATIMTFGGPKGTITLSLMFTIPYTLSSGAMFPMRDELIFVASGVIIVTLLLANFMLPLLAPIQQSAMSSQTAQIQIEILRRTVEELTERITDENRRAVLRVIDSYSKRIKRLKQHTQDSGQEDSQELQIDALHWEKDYIEDRLAKAKAAPEGSDRDDEVEACERMLDMIMNSLLHISDKSTTGRPLSYMRGRLRAFARRLVLLARKMSMAIRHISPSPGEMRIFAHMRQAQIDAIEHVIDQLYHEIGSERYNTEQCSALLLNYRRTEAALRRPPSKADRAEARAQIEEVKQESYAIELSVIQDMLENGGISRAQAKLLRRNVYVMQIDAESGITM